MILGFQGTSLINYPNQISSVIFLSDCNFHCPYCYNKNLVYPNRNNQPLNKDYVFKELKEREHFITAVCITGGEPTLYHFDLIELIKEIKKICPAIKIKIDTNGSRPEVLKNILELELIDYFAIDFKTTPREYKNLISKFDVGETILESINILRNSNVDYEIRITILRELFNYNTAKNISKYLDQKDIVYLQNFKFMGEENHINLKRFVSPETLSYTKEEIEKVALPIFKKCKTYTRNFL